MVKAGWTTILLKTRCVPNAVDLMVIKLVLQRRVIFMGDHLQHGFAESLKYYHFERNQQELAGRLIEPKAEIGSSSRKICSRQRLGGLLNYFPS
jgi:hypothetical protein